MIADTTSFVVGQTYSSRFIADASFRFRFTVVARTKKFVTLTEDGGTERKRVGVFLDRGVERAMPLGRYSMAPTVSADSPNPE